MDVDSAEWLAALRTSGASRDAALVRLHELLWKVATREANRRGPAAKISGPELDDLAQQAADDAMTSILRKLDTFRGESRFTTWAYRFAVLEVSNKIGRHFWRRPSVSLDAEQWNRFPDRAGLGPLGHAQQRELIAAVRKAVDETLTAHQRRVFVALTVDGIPGDALAARLETTRGAIYKTHFDARRKIREFLTTNGYLEKRSSAGRTGKNEAEVERS